MTVAAALKIDSANCICIADDSEISSTCSGSDGFSTPCMSASTSDSSDVEGGCDSFPADDSASLRVVVKSTFIDVADAPSMRQRYNSLRKSKTDSAISDSELEAYLPGKFSDDHDTSHVNVGAGDVGCYQKEALPDFQIQMMQMLVPVQVCPQQTSPLQMQPSTMHADMHVAPPQTPATRTTVMMKNLPNNYTRDMFLGMLNKLGFARRYDFVYLPFDFKRKANLGYAFVNLLDSQTVEAFWKTFDGFSKWSIPSKKVCRVSWSVPHQGLEEHVERYRNSPVMHESVPHEYKPLIFVDGVCQPFPPPTRSITPASNGSR